MPAIQLLGTAATTHEDAQLLVYMLVSRARMGLAAIQQQPRQRDWARQLLNELVSNHHLLHFI
jgi:hypothetical protein